MQQWRGMIRITLAAVVILAGAATLARAQSVSAPLIVSATVVSTCRVEVPRSAEGWTVASVPITVTCARRGATPRVERPTAQRRSEVRDAVLIIDF